MTSLSITISVTVTVEAVGRRFLLDLAIVLKYPRLDTGTAIDMYGEELNAGSALATMTLLLDITGPIL